MKNGKAYRDKKHKLNCPPNSLSKMGLKGGSPDIASSYSLSKKAVKGGGGINRPAGFDKLK